jgi:hypothetical protein
VTDILAWVITFGYGQLQSDWPFLIALIFAYRFLGLEIEFWIPKFLQDGVKDL